VEISIENSPARNGRYMSWQEGTSLYIQEEERNSQTTKNIVRQIFSLEMSTRELSLCKVKKKAFQFIWPLVLPY